MKKASGFLHFLSFFLTVVDVVGVLIGSPEPKNYWKVLKHNMKKEKGQSVTNCNRLKMLAPDGKMGLADIVDTE